MRKVQRQPLDPRTQMVVESQAFRAINLLIDQKASELEGWIGSFKERVEQSYKAAPGVPDGISVRVSQEPDGRRLHKLSANPTMLRHNLGGALDEIARLDREIGDLQRFKLRLLADYDFTHGDDSEQRAVFDNGQSTQT